MGSNSLPYVKTAHSCASVKELENLDRHYAVTHNNHIANQASKQQGRSFLHSTSATYNLPILKDLELIIDENKIVGYQEIIFGFVCGKLEIGLSDCLEMFSFSTLRAMVNSMVRLGKILGPIKAQIMQNEIQNLIPSIISRNVNRSIDQVCAKFPVPDLLQSTHSTLFSRLFYS